MIQAPVTRQEAPDVPLGQIESVLARMWRDADAVTLAAGGQILARNSVMTLVVYAHGAKQARYAARAIEGLTGQHPSRSIILAIDPDVPLGPITANVSIHSHAPQHGIGQVRSEQIVISVNGDVTQHVPGVVLPLLLTEMPAFLWWTGDLPTGDIVDNLIDDCERAIVDSSDFKNPEQSLTRIADLIEGNRLNFTNRTAISDFNWSRLRPWRELTAQFFDSPRFRPYLDGIEHVEVEYAVSDDQPRNPTQAYLFAGWLASRLRWQTHTGHRSGGAVRLGLSNHQGAPVTIEISPKSGVDSLDWWATSSTEWPVQIGDDDGHDAQTPTDEQPTTPDLSTHCVSIGALMRVNIRSRAGDKTASFTIRREDDLKNVTTVVVAEGETMPQRRTPLDTLGETTLLHQQLANFDHDPVYEDAILSARTMVSNDGAKTGKIR